MIFLPEPQITVSWKLCYIEYWFTLNNKLSPLPNSAIWKARRCIFNTGLLIPLHAINPSSFPSCTVWHWRDSGDKPSVTWVARVPQTENAFCLQVKWMSVCETVFARKSQQQTQHWRNAGRSCSNTELGWNYEYAIKKSGFFRVTELEWKGAKKYLWQKQCISWSGNGNALPCHAYAICLPYNFWMFNKL